MATTTVGLHDEQVKTQVTLLKRNSTNLII